MVKFLYAVDKTDAHDVHQALDLLKRWAAIGVADALILLSEDFTHDPNTKNPLNVAVRRFAVQTLEKSASDADLRLCVVAGGGRAACVCACVRACVWGANHDGGCVVFWWWRGGREHAWLRYAHGSPCCCATHI